MVANTANVPHGLLGQRLHHDHGEHREQNDHDEHHADKRDPASRRPHLRAHHIAERTPIAPRRHEQHRHVLDAAGQNHPHQDP